MVAEIQCVAYLCVESGVCGLGGVFPRYSDYPMMIRAAESSFDDFDEIIKLKKDLGKIVDVYQITTDNSPSNIL